MAGFSETDGILYAEGVSLARIADATGTPSYVYSASRMLENLQTLRGAFDEVLPVESSPLIAYACKHNTSMSVLSLFARAGTGLDTVSGGEIEKGLASGIKGRDIVFSGVGKTDAEIGLALKHDVLMFAESRPEIERIAALAKAKGVKGRVGLRYNPDVAADTHAKISTGKKENKFGLPAGEIETIYRLASQDPHLQAEGLSVHIGSQIMDLAPFRAAFERLAGMVRALRAAGLRVEITDLGGGLGVPYNGEAPPCLKTYAQIIRDTILPLGTRIIVEPGRLLTADAGLLLTRVLFVKETETKKFLILDAGMSELLRPALYGAYHPVVPLARRTGKEEPYDIVGPICESSDVFGENRMMPPMQAGDLVAVMVAGAMGMTMASAYNTRPLPPEILVSGDRFATVRQRQTVQDIMKTETVPDWITD